MPGFLDAIFRQIHNFVLEQSTECVKMRKPDLTEYLHTKSNAGKHELNDDAHFRRLSKNNRELKKPNDKRSKVYDNVIFCTENTIEKVAYVWYKK